MTSSLDLELGDFLNEVHEHMAPTPRWAYHVEYHRRVSEQQTTFRLEACPWFGGRWQLASTKVVITDEQVRRTPARRMAARMFAGDMLRHLERLADPPLAAA